MWCFSSVYFFCVLTDFCATQGQNSRQLEAFCGNGKDHPARLRISTASSTNEKAEILFTNVEQVDCVMSDQNIKTVVLKLFESDEHFRFYTDSDIDTMNWFRYCGMLCAIPFCIIPKIPKENFVLQSHIDKYANPKIFNASM